MKWCFIVFLLYLGLLFFFDQPVPADWVERFVESRLRGRYLMRVESVSFGLRTGVHVRGLRLYDVRRDNPLEVVFRADAIDLHPVMKRLEAVGVRYDRLPDGYYGGSSPSSEAEDGRREPFAPPALGRWLVRLERPSVLGVSPEQVTLDVDVGTNRVDFGRIHLVWPDREAKIGVDGFCTVDFDRQEVVGEVDGFARQSYIRPLLVALDVPVALPYMDAFTEVPEPCKAKCAWKVDLTDNSLDLLVDLHPVLGKYNSVPMKRADGAIRVRNRVRNGSLDYKTTVGPLDAVDPEGRPLRGTVTVCGTNGCNTVDVEAASAMLLADVLKIGGFAGDYVGSEVFGESECRLHFAFPRAMTNNYEVLNGSGSVSVKNGQLMRMKGFRGLVDAMPSIAPAVTWFSDSTQASADYVIENGVVRSDNIYIEGTLFSIKMYGRFDAVHDDLDFTVRVQFAQKDSLLGKMLHPLAWPFTKLLLEFRLMGSAANPRWKYISIIDRILDTVL